MSIRVYQLLAQRDHFRCLLVQAVNRLALVHAYRPADAEQYVVYQPLKQISAWKFGAEELLRYV